MDWLKQHYPGLVRFWHRYERHIGVGALVFGFILDSLTLNRPDQLLDNAILLAYLVLAGGSILLLSMRASRGRDGALTLFLPVMLQFCFGNLTSGLLVLYFRSGTLVQSLFFFLILGTLLVGNEYLKSRYAQFRFNIAIYYLLLLCYVVMTVPVLLHRIGVLVFLVSVAVSLVLVALYLAVLLSAARKEIVRHVRPAAAIVLVICLVFNLLYFLNIIPPVPLALRDIGIYHSLLKRSEGGYIALYEPSPWWQVWRDTSSTYTLTAADGVSCFSSVFAPTDLRAPIFHRWEKYNEAAHEWQTQARISFEIAGGRGEGYRGYTTKSSLTPGRWRCSVETSGGALIGRTSFRVVDGSEAPALSQKTL